MVRGGYAWWYVDALSDDGTQALALIAFVGSVFSPYYAARRRRQGAAAAHPADHVAINLSLYGPGRKLWAMTERGAGHLQRAPQQLCIGPSRLGWDGDALAIEVDEWALPWPRRLRGRLRVQPLARGTHVQALDAAGRHRWCPIAPRARIEVDLPLPGLRWQGEAYVDGNFGDAPLEQDFARWDWARASLPDGRSAVLYDVERRDGSRLALALQFDADGSAHAAEPPPERALPRTGWGLVRHGRSEADARVLRTVEDGPFYARSLLQARWFGAPVTAMHESLSLRRFGARWVQALLPWRMPRRR